MFTIVLPPVVSAVPALRISSQDKRAESNEDARTDQKTRESHSYVLALNQQQKQK
jgi:hypothetical protein